MNPSQNADIASDLAYVRSLAEEGAHAPLIGGRYYVLWGGLMGAASLVVYMNALELVKFGQTGFMVPWIIAGIVGWGVSFAMRRGVSAKPGAATLGNRTAAAVWFAVGIVMTMFFIGLLFAHDNYAGFGVPPYFLFSLLYPIGFVLYGVAFFSTATAARAPWLRYFAFLSWAFAIAMLFMLATAEQFLVGAVGILACAFAPGIMLMRNEPADIV